MVKQLRKRLLAIYMLTSSFLLTIIIFIIFMVSQNQYKNNAIKHFEDKFRSITTQISESNSLSHDWLAKTELENNLIISISSNSVEIGRKESWQPSTDRSSLLQKLRYLASGNGVSSMESLRLLNHSSISPVYSLYGNDKDHYYGCVLQKTMSNKTLTIYMLQLLSDEKKQLQSLVFLCIIINLAGITVFYFISRLIVSKTLLPLQAGLRRQNEFIAAASHELRSPLTVISAGINALKLDHTKTDEFIPRIDREGKRMARLIDDLLILASTDAKTWQLHTEITFMDSFFINAYETLSQFCHTKKQTLQLDLPDCELPSLSCDRQRLEQILIILVDNASSYSPEETEISLQVTSGKRFLTMKVIDHGCGIPDLDKSRIFDRFFRSDQSRSDKKHFGLGLSIASELIHLHGGKISVQNTDGGGSTFTVEIPLSKK